MNAPRDYPREVSELLEKFRRGIRRYVLLRGSALVVVIVCLSVWATFTIDRGYFQVDRSDLPLWLRGVLLATSCGAVLAALLNFVVFRVWRDFSARSLATVLERQFPNLESRLLTVVELAEDSASAEGLSGEMYARTAGELRRLLEGLPWKNAFDWRPLRQASTLAVVSVMSIGILGGMFPENFRLWFERDVLLREVSWPRETRYQMWAKLPGQERLIELREGRLYHPRGGDLALLVQIEKGSRVPDRVELRFQEAQGGARNRGFFTRQGEDKFLYTLTGVSQDLLFQVRAGDAERHWSRVEVVDPPRIERMDYVPEYPAYTKLAPEGGRPEGQPVIDSTVSLPIGTVLKLSGYCNKPMVRVEIETDRFAVRLEKGKGTISVFDANSSEVRGEEVTIADAGEWLAGDGSGFQLPLQMAAGGVSAGIAKGSGGNSLIPINGAEALRISLEDEQGIRTSEPMRLNLRGVEDEAPRVMTMLYGVGASITRKAMIPVQGKVTDDYGVEEGYFEYQIDGNADVKKGTLQSPPGGEREFSLSRQGDQAWEILDVRPLELKEGQKLAVGLTAADGDTLGGPHRTTGERYQFQIVSDEGLLSLLHARELNLRQRFEQIMAELGRLRADLATLQQGPAEGGDRTNEKGIVSRNLLGLRKNHNESMSVEQGFGEILRETLNNRIETTQSLERLELRLIRPLHALNADDYNEADQDLGELQVLMENGGSPAAPAGAIVGRLERMLAKMETILKEMRRLETYGELVEMLKSIKTEQEELRRQTERERKRQAIEGLK